MEISELTLLRLKTIFRGLPLREIEIMLEDVLGCMVIYSTPYQVTFTFDNLYCYKFLYSDLVIPNEADIYRTVSEELRQHLLPSQQVNSVLTKSPIYPPFIYKTEEEQWQYEQDVKVLLDLLELNGFNTNLINCEYTLFSYFDENLILLDYMGLFGINTYYKNNIS